ncbi:hypothetical protein [Chromobacterium violaceum]|uniref:hypothetical protein n=1 Tax=Chromobacterium violaceum TaxID=536 RepID=UPI000B06375E|nr:hypothetical protein [Chromobacterium violaceum]MBP4046460.1 hypothetical protein [Chromobacterium violaceum]MBT2866688.1 hypothetical protein [Chromobacterium violaceum]QRO32142.1 hypothetical protein I6K04_16860 [Chromobacterium violaceum]QRQ18057.1 hypothetical protein I6K03_05870 [Chromobacterium violaceum]
MKQWILAAIAVGSLAGCVVEPPRMAAAPVVVRPAVVVPVAPAYYYDYGPRRGWR